MALSKKQIKQLRALANHLNPQIIVGKNDLSDAAYAQADETLEKHELVKCTVLDGSGLDAKDAAQHLADRLRAQVVQVIGNRCVIYRETHDEKVTKIRLVRE
ncbi:YhbY family RNA-binding protein [Bifidobacterium crudilactis]|jgi:RNA-binding protein|uniref:YhbY family RNA-binding protein n=1 Tax=Bifidobacterium crudilactis TaxID=327277 RepID=UPI003A5C1B4C